MCHKKRHVKRHVSEGRSSATVIAGLHRFLVPSLPKTLTGRRQRNAFLVRSRARCLQPYWNPWSWRPRRWVHLAKHKVADPLIEAAVSPTVCYSVSLGRCSMVRPKSSIKLSPTLMSRSFANIAIKWWLPSAKSGKRSWWSSIVVVSIERISSPRPWSIGTGSFASTS